MTRRIERIEETANWLLDEWGIPPKEAMTIAVEIHRNDVWEDIFLLNGPTSDYSMSALEMLCKCLGAPDFSIPDAIERLAMNIDRATDLYAELEYEKKKVTL
tara:strand:+ start:207 stop:512 length:306 start_codon:yes stop_codon:yes gene_type:complete